MLGRLAIVRGGILDYRPGRNRSPRSTVTAGIVAASSVLPGSTSGGWEPRKAAAAAGTGPFWVFTGLPGLSLSTLLSTSRSRSPTRPLLMVGAASPASVLWVPGSCSSTRSCSATPEVADDLVARRPGRGSGPSTVASAAHVDAPAPRSRRAALHHPVGAQAPRPGAPVDLELIRECIELATQAPTGGEQPGLALRRGHRRGQARPRPSGTPEASHVRRPRRRARHSPGRPATSPPPGR